VIDSILNLLFRCPHRRLTRPVTPVGRTGEPEGGTYVVCLDCGKEFSYDLERMRLGKPVKQGSGTGVLPPDAPKGRSRKMRMALWASVASLGWMVVRGALEKKDHARLEGLRARG
jgi:hypothetical protein